MQIGRFPPDVCHTHGMVHRAGSATSGRIEGSESAVLHGSLGDHVVQDGAEVSHVIPEGATATAVMRGFEVHSSFEHGFQTRGFGFDLSNIRQRTEEGTTVLSFVPRYSIFPDRSPDPFTNPDHFLWRLIPFMPVLGPRTPDDFTYTLTLHYTILFDDADRACFTDHHVRHGPLKSRHVGPSAARRSLPHQLSGEAGGAYRNASVGIRGFRWELLHWPGTRLDGRYLRKVQCMLDGLEYDPQDGELTVSTKTEFNNFGGRQGREQVRRWITFLRERGVGTQERLRALARLLRLSYGFVVQFDLNLTMLQFKDGDNQPVNHLYNVIRKSTVAARRFDL